MAEQEKDDSCEEDMEAYEEARKKINHFNAQLYSDFYWDAMEDIRHELSIDGC